MRFKTESRRGDLNGFLDAGSHIQGELHFDDVFRIDGRLTGRVVSEGELVVGDKGEVDGEIEVGSVVVSGVVRGRIRASRRVEIAASGRVLADLETPTLVVEEGGRLQGQCLMLREEEAAKLVAAKVAAALPPAASGEKPKSGERAN
jgi:cytoskeletal protein CcmA (bactofilin family)